MRALSPRESRGLAVLALVAAIALADFALVQPLLDGFAARAAQRDQLAARYAANQRLIAAVPRLVRRAERRDEALGRIVMPTADPLAAADALHARVQAAIAKTGGDVRGTEDLPGEPGRVAMRVGLRVTPAQMARLIAEIENARPIITITALSIGSDDAQVTGHVAELDVQIELALACRTTPSRPK